jgi:hypothetical protein
MHYGCRISRPQHHYITTTHEVKAIPNNAGALRRKAQTFLAGKSIKQGLGVSV